jgi:hypothetical protein
MSSENRAVARRVPQIARNMTKAVYQPPCFGFLFGRSDRVQRSPDLRPQQRGQPNSLGARQLAHRTAVTSLRSTADGRLTSRCGSSRGVNISRHDYAPSPLP